MAIVFHTRPIRMDGHPATSPPERPAQEPPSETPATDAVTIAFSPGPLPPGAAAVAAALARCPAPLLLASPVDTYFVSSEYGPRDGRMHRGIDLAAEEGEPVHAVVSGTVDYVEDEGSGYGKVVDVLHDSGHLTRYAHLSRFAEVRVGDRIQSRGVLGYVGSSGTSTGPHLHFEWHLPSGRTVNPRRYVAFTPRVTPLLVEDIPGDVEQPH